MKPALPDLNPVRLATAARKRIFSHQKKPAQSPGTLVHVGERKVEDLNLSVAVFDEKDAKFYPDAKLEEHLHAPDAGKVTWLHVTGLHDIEKIENLGGVYGVHPLILEDILNTSARSKIEDSNDCVFLSTRLVHFDEGEGMMDVQHFSLLLLPNSVVITFVEAPTPIFEAVKQRIRSGAGGRIRSAGADYLAWALMDSVIDHYFRVVDQIDEMIIEMDDRLQLDESSVEVNDLYELKKEVAALYRLVRPIREIVTVLHRSDSSLMSDYARPYYRDLYDHGVHVIEHTEDIRELASSLRDFYLTVVSNRMNEIMKVLTCFATIFLPLTFFAGIYGMNFEVMPELKLPWAYPALWLVFLGAAAGMFFFFRRKKWL